MPFLLPPPSRGTEEGRRVAGGAWAGGLGCDSGHGEGEKGEGVAVGRFPHLIWAEVACGGAAMVAGGGRL